MAIASGAVRAKRRAIELMAYRPTSITANSAGIS
jgi:hypothetical protein